MSGERKRPVAAAPRDPQGDEGKGAKRSAVASLSSLRGVTIVRNKGAVGAGKPLPAASDPVPDGAGGAGALGMIADYGSGSESD